jgi:hypothetical protein
LSKCSDAKGKQLPLTMASFGLTGVGRTVPLTHNNGSLLPTAAVADDARSPVTRQPAARSGVAGDNTCDDVTTPSLLDVEQHKAFGKTSALISEDSTQRLFLFGGDDSAQRRSSNGIDRLAARQRVVRQFDVVNGTVPNIIINTRSGRNLLSR